VTQSFFTRVGYSLHGAAGSFGGLALDADDHLGLIGNFPSLVRQAEAMGCRVSVVERKHHMLMEQGRVQITLDPSVLRRCNKIISTAATLINDTLDSMLEYCGGAEQIGVIGPTAGIFPDPLFSRAVDFVGGTQILDAAQAIARAAAGEKFGDAARRYVIQKDAYPGFEALLAARS
jgi:uncharacterized protein (DUF4213/DUF364 family)